MLGIYVQMPLGFVILTHHSTDKKLILFCMKIEEKSPYQFLFPAFEA